jgi:hypothetical protein
MGLDLSSARGKEENWQLCGPLVGMPGTARLRWPREPRDYAMIIRTPVGCAFSFSAGERGRSRTPLRVYPVWAPRACFSGCRVAKIYER